MPSAETARRRLRVVNFRASRVEIERWDVLAEAAGLTRSAWVREILKREGRRLESARRVREVGGWWTCTCPDVPSGAFCVLCGLEKRWTLYRQWLARERMRRLRAER